MPCQLCSRAEYEEAVRARARDTQGHKLSPALMEVLSIVAYRQPVTKAYIEQVRGVDCSYSITALLDRSMIENVGHLDLPGRPALYGTTPDFLRVFGISSLDELPPIELFDAVGGQNVGSPSAGRRRLRRLRRRPATPTAARIMRLSLRKTTMRIIIWLIRLLRQNQAMPTAARRTRLLTRSLTRVTVLRMTVRRIERIAELRRLERRSAERNFSTDP